jgi:hypothetical protein
VVNGWDKGTEGNKILDDKIFTNDLLILPDFFHDASVLDHTFFQNVASIRSLPAEFQILISKKNGHSLTSDPGSDLNQILNDKRG